MRKALRLLAVNLLVLVVGIVLLDACLSGRLDMSPTADYSPELDIIVNRPNLRRYAQAERYRNSQLETFQYSVYTDGEGCRVSASPSPPRDGVPKVALVGDSFTYGMHGEYEDTLAGRLGSALPGVDVYNFGVPGTCSPEYGRLLSYYLRKKNGLRVSAVAVGYYVDTVCGDIPRLVARRQYGGYRVFDGYPVSPTNYRRFKESAWARALFRAQVFLRAHSSIYNRLVPPRPDPDFATPLGPNISADVAAFTSAQVMEGLEGVRAAANLGPGQIVVVLIPSAGETKSMKAKQLGSSRLPDSRLLWDGIAQQASAAGYRIVDVRSLFVERTRTGQWPFTTDSHLTAEGFEWLSGPVAEELRKALDQR